MVALRAKACDHAGSDTRDVGMVAERFPLVDIRDVDFDNWIVEGVQCIEDRNGGVGKRGRIDHDACRVLPRLMYPIDNLELGIALQEPNGEAMLDRNAGAIALHICQCFMAVDRWLSFSKKIEVGAVKHVDEFAHGRFLLLNGNVREAALPGEKGVEMPHITIEYSQGAKARVDISRLAQGVHVAARASGIFPANAVRTFAREATISFVADEHPENVFVQIVARVAPGRPADLLKRIADLLFAAAAAEAAEALEAGRFALRVDLTESDPALSAYRNTLPT